MVLQTIFGEERDLDIPKELAFTEDEQRSMDELLKGSEHGWFDSCYQNAKLHYRKWLPPANAKPKAIIVYMHGIRGHANNAFEIDGRKLNMALVAEVYLKEGYAIYAFDHYGHGFSEGERFWIPESYENNVKDYMKFVNMAASFHDGSIPLFLQGESYGSTLSILLAKQFQDDPSSGPKNFNSLIMTCPAIIGDLPPYPVYFVLRYMIAPCFPKACPFFMPNLLGPERIWRDEKVLKAHTESRLAEMQVDGAGGKFRLGTALNLVLALEACREAITSLHVPFCIAHGTCDYGVPIDGSDYMWSMAKTPESEREYLKVEGAYHDLLGDPEAERVMQFCLSFIKQRMNEK